jgi:Na+/phosphate symporter
LAKLTKEETELKIKAFEEAIYTLKKKSNGKINFLTQRNVLDYVNNCSYSKQFTSKISPATIKQTKNEKFKKFNEEIKKFRKEFNLVNKLGNVKLTKKVDDSQEKVIELTYHLAIYLEENERLLKKIEQRENKINQLEKDINHYLEIITQLKENL